MKYLSPSLVFVQTELDPTGSRFSDGLLSAVLVLASVLGSVGLLKAGRLSGAVVRGCGLVLLDLKNQD